MKKITFVIFAFLLSFSAFAQFPEGFEGTWTTGSGPAGWAIINTGPGPVQAWQQLSNSTDYPAHTGNSAAFMNRENVTNGTVTNDWLITPQFVVPADGQLTFWSRLTLDDDQGTVYKIFIGNSTTDITAFTELKSWTELQLNTDQLQYEYKQVDIPASYVGQTLRLAFVMQGDNGDRWLVDDVNVVTRCIAPTALGIVGTPGTTTTDLTWTENNGGNSWEIEVLPATSTPARQGVSYTGALPYTAPNLQPSTAYVYYVRSKCNADGSNNSLWAGPFAFTTSQEPAQLNWFTDFESANSGFTFVNGTQTNKWAIGTATSNSPSHALYISADGGVTNFYTNSSASVVHAYRDVFIPQGAGEVIFNYDWKSLGESGADYLRVWSTPQSYTPVAGAQTTAVNTNYKNLSGNLIGPSTTTWTTATHNMDVSAYAGTVRRFIFEWTNNASGGLQPPAAIDNVIFTLVTCPQPTNLTAPAVNMNNADLAWTQPGDATQWQVYVVPAAAAGPTPATVGEVVNGTPAYNAPNLTPGTAYKYYVRAHCNDTDISVWSGPFMFNTQLCDAVDQCVYRFNMTDSASDGWNGNTMTVSQNGVTIATLTMASGAAASQTVTVCNNNPLTLFWNSGGSWASEVGVSIVNNFGQVIYTKVAGTGSANTSLYTGTVNCAVPLCLPPTGLTVAGIGQNEATLTWGTATTGNWEYYIVPAGSPAPTDATAGTPVTTNTVPLNNLTPSTAYTYYVRIICNNGASSSVWSAGYTFTTTQIPAPLNFNDNFENGLSWTLVNGTQTNKWFFGTAVSNSPTHSLYVTNDNGTSNTYNNGSTSVVQAYRDIAVPAGTTEVNLAFDWRNQGEGTAGGTIYDYVTAFVVPTSYSPVAGTNMVGADLGGGTQITGLLFGNSGWTNFSQTFNASAYAGNTMRVVFQWRNDGSGGTNPPGAVDNVVLTKITCPQPSALTLTPGSITQNGAAFTWTETASATAWEILIQPANAPAPTETSTGIRVDGTPAYTATTLNPSTGYTVYVRAICSDSDKSLWTGPINFSTTQIPIPLNYTDDFEGGLSWTLVNGSQANTWYYGTAVSNSPTHSLYVTNNGGVANAYTNSSTSVVHAYRDIAVPAGTTEVNLAFDWRNLGEGTTGGTIYDYVTAFVVPATYFPTAGTNMVGANLNGGTQVTGLLFNNSNWTNFSQTFNATAYAGGTMRVVFQWRNDGSGGTNPPGAIDNVVLTRITCPQPSALALTPNSVNQNGATFTWTETGTATAWEVIVQPATDPAPTPASTGVRVDGTRSYTASTLNPSTAYVAYVRAICSDTDKSLWTGPASFTTTQIPGELNYNDNFESDFNWTVVNGTQTNKWFYGTAVSNSPTHSLYVTNNNGTSNAYTNSATSVTQVYRDIAIPAGTAEVNLAFDWRNLGEGTTGGTIYDYLTAFVVPSTYLPVAGTNMVGANLNGGTQLTGLLFNNSNWTNFSQTFNATAYAGGTMRVVFQWRNDGSGGSNPPAAVDNVVVTKITCPQPRTLAITPNSITSNAATFTWVEPGTATSWEVIVQPATAPAPTTTSTGERVDGTPTYTATNLSTSTAYVAYVRAICSDTDKSVWSGPLSFTTTQIPGELDYNDDLEAGSDWTLVNGTQTNKWFYGTAVSASPTHSLYITNNNGVANAYTTSSASIVHAYRDIAIPAGYNDVEISFKWRNRGEGSTTGTIYDYLTAFVVPTTYMPTAGTNMIGAATGGSQLTGQLFNNANWTTSTNQMNVTPYSGGTMRLVFQWRNDSSGGANPPAAVDDIVITYVPCAAPSNLVINCLTSEGLNFSWGGSTTSATQWEVAVLPTSAGTPTSGTVVNVPDYTYEGTLQQGVSYSAWVRTICPDGSGYSAWSNISAVGPYVSVGNAQALCAGVLAVPQQSNSGGTIPTYGTVGCLISTPNPTWYYVTLGGDGAVSLNLSQVRDSNGQGIDVDFAIFGPFESKLQACSILGTPPNSSYIVDCSFSPDAVEQIDFTGNAGDVFALLVTNYNGDPGHATITQISGPPVSCNPTVELGPDRSFCSTDSYNLTATVDNPGEAQVYTYTWFKDTQPFTPTIVSTTATTQTIQVTDAGSHVYTVVVSMPNPTSPDPVTDTTTISLSHQYTAPVYTPITVCSQATTADVNLATVNYLGTLDPTVYTLVGVYTSFADANANVSAIDTTVLYNTGSTTLYAVVTDILSPLCKKIVPLQITVNQVGGTLNYDAAYCTSDVPSQSGLVQVGGTPGTYAATPAGLTIDATTGEITPATSATGTYHIVYTIPAQGDCPATLVEDDVEIINAPVATTIEYPGAYCNAAGTTAVVTLVGTTGGTFAGDAGLVIDVTTGNVDLSASTPGVHTVTYTLPAAGSCSLPPVTATIEINAQLSGTFDYPRASYCTSEGTVSVTNFVGSINGVYLATPATGLAINPATGEIDLANSTAGTYDVVYHFDATASCAAYTSPAVQVTVTEMPVTTVTYDGPYCNTAGVVGTPTVTGTQGGAFTGDAGLVIDGTTGIIDLGTSTAGIHVVTYTPPVSGGVCTEAPITITIEINAQLSGTFDYPRASYCSSEGTVSVTNFVGSINGTYLATPAGLAINPATGEIDLTTSAAGVYDIVYHFDASNSCLAYTSPVFQLTVVTQPVTTIDYGTAPFCNVAGFTANVTLTGTQGGVFTATPAGLVINAATGEIDLGTSAPNTYTVSYAPPATGPCSEAPVTASVVISSSLSATIAYPSAVYCSDAGTTLPTQIGNTGGVYEFTPAGLSIDATTGEIDLGASTAGTYTITYHIVAAGACGDFFSVPVTVEINAAPDSATVISYASSTFCSNAGIVAATVTGTQGGTYAATPSTLVINATTGEIDVTNSPVGTYQITYTTPATAPCTPFTTPAVSVTINELPTVSIAYAGSPYCSNQGMATVATTGTGAYTGGAYSSSIGLVINATTGEIDLALSDAGTYQVVYTVTGPAGCGVITSAPATVVITKLPVPGFTYATLITCNAAGQPVIMPTYVPGGVAGTFTVDHPGLTIDPATGYIDPVSSAVGTYIITNTVTGTDGCVGNNPVSAPVTVQITPAPVANFSYSALAYCQASATTVSPSLAGVAGTFTSTPAGLVINATTGVIDVAASTPGIYEVVNSIAASTDCPGVVSTPVFVTITAQPVISTADGCEGNEYQLHVNLDADPVYSVEDVDIVWTSTSPTGTVIGNDEVAVITTPGTYYVTVTPKTGAVCSVVLPVTVANTFCNIQKGISPGGTEGQNDNFDLTGLNVRKISIFNRYGKEVYKFEGAYTNQWHGQTGNGEELPTGTYFYTIYRANGENRTGWIYVNRDVK